MYMYKWSYQLVCIEHKEKIDLGGIYFSVCTQIFFLFFVFSLFSFWLSSSFPRHHFSTDTHSPLSCWKVSYCHLYIFLIRIILISSSFLVLVKLLLQRRRIRASTWNAYTIFLIKNQGNPREWKKMVCEERERENVDILYKILTCERIEKPKNAISTQRWELKRDKKKNFFEESSTRSEWQSKTKNGEEWWKEE